MATETMTNNNPTWPTPNESATLPQSATNMADTSGEDVVVPLPNVIPSDPNPEWEMIADTEEDEAQAIGASSIMGKKHFVNMPTAVASSTNKLKVVGRPRSATVGHEAAPPVPGTTPSPVSATNCGNSINSNSNSSVCSNSSDVPKINRRTLRRCASTPDLGNDRDIIVEEESSDDDEDEGSDSAELSNVGDDDDEEDDGNYEDEDNDESFEVLSEKDNEDDDDDEPVMVDEEDTEELEEGTMVSTPSMDTSGWTMASPSIASSTAPVAKTSVWGGASAPSFKDILSKNTGDHHHRVDWGNKSTVEAVLHDSHRKHRLHVRTKPKLIVVEDGNSSGTNSAAAGGKMLKHAHSTGDLTQMMEGVEEERKRAFGRGRRKKFDGILEEDEDADFVIGNGGGSGGGGGGGGGGGDVLGDTDAMDYYHRKEKGSVSNTLKKKERPDEAKRKEIIMYKKDMQRKQQQEKAAKSGGGNAAAGGDAAGGGKKKKNEKGFGGKKERRRG